MSQSRLEETAQTAQIVDGKALAAAVRADVSQRVAR